MTLFWMTITPCGSALMITPWNAIGPARAATNDGTPISATNEPWKAPITAPGRQEHGGHLAIPVAGRSVRLHLLPAEDRDGHLRGGGSLRLHGLVDRHRLPAGQDVL